MEKVHKKNDEIQFGEELSENEKELYDELNSIVLAWQVLLTPFPEHSLLLWLLGHLSLPISG